ncbi:MAG: CCA tRNA nucleotidyltransferase [Candidatus Diapherotrites archaeon]|nr:CCA tRNA nucleotidyltransferase [Candidatus Diapherotrites archaeon]
MPHAKLQDLYVQVLEKIKPSEREVESELAFANALLDQIRKTKGPHIHTVLAGSLARNTHLKNDRDIDLFVLYPKNLERSAFEKEGLQLGKKIFAKNKYEIAYSEHPYVRGIIQGYEVEIVPSYHVENANELKSAVDRSPLHVQYLLGALNSKKCDEVRLFKQFLKGINAYGADTKFNSLPGYATELLIIHYGSFNALLEGMRAWRMQECIDIKNHYKNPGEALKKFNAPLVIVDPTDANRNVAAALSFNQYCRMIAAAHAFMKKPSKAFFFGKKEKPWPLRRVQNALNTKELIALQLQYPKNVLPDIVWGQTRRMGKKIRTALEQNDFRPVRNAEWTDEKKMIVLLFELESLELEKTRIRKGPFVTDPASTQRFLNAHKKPLGGPRIEEGRWVIETPRAHTHARTFMEHYLPALKATEKPEMKKALQHARILDEPALQRLYKKSKAFQPFFTHYLDGKEKFLEY